MNSTFKSLMSVTLLLQKYKLPVVDMTPININTTSRVDSERRRLLESSSGNKSSRQAQRQLRYDRSILSKGVKSCLNQQPLHEYGGESGALLARRRNSHKHHVWVVQTIACARDEMQLLFFAVGFHQFYVSLHNVQCAFIEIIKFDLTMCYQINFGAIYSDYYWSCPPSHLLM